MYININNTYGGKEFNNDKSLSSINISNKSELNSFENCDIYLS